MTKDASANYLVSGLISSYETSPLCAAGELDLDLLGDAGVLLRRLGGEGSEDLESQGPSLLDLDFLPLVLRKG